MGNLIRINKSRNVSSNKFKKFDVKENNDKGQLLMFTGIRYERQAEKNTTNTRSNKKHKSG